MKYAMLSVPMKHNSVIILQNGTTGCSRGKHNRISHISIANGPLHVIHYFRFGNFNEKHKAAK
jgi:hypothetical protein